MVTMTQLLALHRPPTAVYCADENIIKSLYKIACKITEAFKISMKKYYLLDYEFHLKIIKESGLNLLIKEYEKLSTVCMISSEFLGLDYFGNNGGVQVSQFSMLLPPESGVGFEVVF